jgi:hypothetical protein
MHRSILAATLALALVLAVLPLGAQAVNIKNVTAPEAVFLGLGDIIDRELVHVRAKYVTRPDPYILVLSLEELRTGGEVIFLGEQAIPMAALNVIAEDGGDGRAVVEVAWTTGAIVLNSDIIACAEVLKQTNRGDVVVSDLECRTLDPIPPL